jgi:polyhydroxyalkanoate synthesis regulator phasin
MPSEGLIEKLKARGEEVFAQVSAQLMSNPQFMKAVGSAMKGKEKLDHAVGRVLKQMNIPTRSEFKRAVARIDALERELAELKAKAKPAPSRPRKRDRRPKPAPEPAAE